MSNQVSKTKEPLLRMAKRDAITSKQAWTIRGIAFLLALVTGGLLIWAHRGNIQRLISGTESKFSIHKS